MMTDEQVYPFNMQSDKAGVDEHPTLARMAGDWPSIPHAFWRDEEQRFSRPSDKAGVDEHVSRLGMRMK